MFFAPTVRTARFAPRAHDRGFERFVNDALLASTQRPVHVAQDEAAWTLSLDVPGLSRDDLSIGIEGAVVRIESKPEAKRQVKAAYELPQPIDASASEAKLEHGVLTMKLAKLAPVSNVSPLTIN
ncbi:Hsp20/alpha crystallin family protein [Variovorax ginsengisoli]|uniref:HSP20 family molecular chaperone IbpA n=1 Tax=Variovorax ginsengisoli TaxID=363844 RepID=A0ABT9SAV8_9BURK|nr:Hsp20/alpha crystallin family protein [Variovorax ginsengisoli]MDP9901494.1 HSP20 family molecular chaperone IbpA [Variovorax ginsengisoli]